MMDDILPTPPACPRCGTTISANDTDGVCPRCLLGEALQPEEQPQPPPAVSLTGAATLSVDDWSSAATMRVAAPTPSMSQPRQELDLPLPEELTRLLPPNAYQVEGFLGQGGMGAVYKGVQVRLKRAVAIKIMRRDMGRDMDFEARFEREAQAMAKLNHPNIVSVIDFGEAGANYLYIVMELVDGADMMDVIRGGQMTQEMALSLLPQICDALQFAHDHGIVHRDIKPSNIMLTRDGRIKMADFGLAKRYDVEDSFRTQTGTGMGTPDYAAPEQFDPRASIDHRADIYALGVMIYQMITGQLPRGVWKSPSERAKVAPEWDDIVSRAMQSDPADRYQQASEVKTDVSSIPLTQQGAQGPTPPARKGSTTTKKSTTTQSGKRQPAEEEEPPPAKSRMPLVWSAIAGVVVIVLGALFVLKKPAPENATVPTGATVSTPSVPVASSATLPTPAPQVESGWKPFLPDAWNAREPGKRESKDGLLHLTNHVENKVYSSPDGAIRTRVQIREGTQTPALVVRGTDAGNYKLFLAPYGQKNQEIHLVLYQGSQGEKLGQYLLPAPLKNGDTLRLELRASGPHLLAVVNEIPAIDVHDARLTEAGKWGIMANDGWFESVEVQTQPAAIPPQPEPGWQPLFTKTEWQSTEHKHAFKDGLVHIQQGTWRKAMESPNGAIRARVRLQADSKVPVVLARFGKDSQAYALGLSNTADSVFISIWGAAKDATQTRFPLPKTLSAGDTLTLELRVVDNQLTAIVDGAVLGKLTDNQIKSPGEWGIGSGYDAWFESVEVQTLPAAAERWQDVTKDIAKLMPYNGAALVPEGILLPPTAGIGMNRFADVLGQDAAVRIKTTFGGQRLQIRARSTKGNFYSLTATDEKTIVLERYENTKGINLRNFALSKALQPGQDYEMELRCVGETLTAFLDEQVLGSVTDGVLKEGIIGVVAWDASAPACLLKAVKILPLGKPAGAASTFGGHRYQLVEFTCTWAEAKAKAESMGGHLATLTSEAEELWTRDHLFSPMTAEESSQPNAGMNKLYWLGARAAAQSRDILWLTGETVGKLQWRDGNPGWRADASQKSTQDLGGPLFTACLAVHQTLSTGKWATIQPDSLKRAGFIIEWDGPISTPPAKFPPGQWVKLFTKAEDLPDDLRKPESGVKWENGWLRYGGQLRNLNLPIGALRNVGVRVTTVRQSGQENTADTDIGLRKNADGTSRYQSGIKKGGTIFGAQKRLQNDYPILWAAQLPKPTKMGETCRLEFAAVENRLIGRFDGTVFKSAIDTSLASGFASISSAEDIRDIEVINLDGLPEVEALRLLGVDPNGNDLRAKNAAVSSSAQFPPGQWVKVFTQEDDIPVKNREAKDLVLKDGWLDGSGAVNTPAFIIPGSRGKNRAIRMHGKLIPEGRMSLGFALFLNWGAQENYQLNVFDLANNPTASMVLYNRVTKQGKDLNYMRLKPGAKAGDEFDMEFAMISGRLMARINDSLIPMTMDARLPEGEVAFQTNHLVRDIEVINLDGLPEAEALKILGVDENGKDLRAKNAATEKWQNMLSDPAKLSFIRQVERTAEGLRLTENSSAFDSSTEFKQRDGAVRLRAVYEGGLSVAIRARAFNGPSYQLYASSATHVTLLRNVEYGKTESLANYRLKKPFHAGQEYELELRVIGAELTAKLDGEVLGTVRDTNITQGNFGIAAAGSGASVLVKALDFLNLDKPASAASSDKYPPGQWVKLFTKADDLPDELRKPDSGVTWQDGWIRGLKAGHVLPMPSSITGNYAIRLRSTYQTGSLFGEGVVVRRQEPADKSKRGHYQTKFDGKLLVQQMVGGEYQTLHSSEPSDAPKDGADYTLEVGVVGKHLVSRLNSTRASLLMEDGFSRGKAFLAVLVPFRDIEVINLDGLPEAETLRLLGVDAEGKDLRAAK